MKCQYQQCGGTLILDPGDYLNSPRLKCFMCGRELKKEREEMSTHPMEINQEREKSDSLEKSKEIKTKICKKYGSPHKMPLTEFAKNSSTPDGLERSCKTCMKRYRVEQKKHKAEKVMKRNPEKKIKNVNVISLPTDIIQLEAQLIQGVRKALRKEFAQEFIDMIREMVGI